MSARADCPIVLPEIQHRRSYLCRFKVHGQPMRQTSELDGSLRASCTHYGLGVTKKIFCWRRDKQNSAHASKTLDGGFCKY